MILVADRPGAYLSPPSRLGWGPLASIGVHGLALTLLLTASVLRPLDPPEIRSIAVDLISPAQFARLLAPPVSPPQAPAPALATPTRLPDAAAPDLATPPAATPTPETGPIRATTFYSGAVLAEPESAGLRRGLASTEPRERLVQICGIEAMEQIRRARPEFDPDIVVAYAYAETELRGGALTATGAAFRSHREWYHAPFTCTATADLRGVAAFEVSVGAVIPHDEWDAHYLTAEEVGD